MPEISRFTYQQQLVVQGSCPPMRGFLGHCTKRKKSILSFSIQHLQTEICTDQCRCMTHYSETVLLEHFKTASDIKIFTEKLNSVVQHVLLETTVVTFKLRQAASANQASCNMRFLRIDLCRPLPSLFLLRLAFYFVISLSFKSSLNQRFTTRPNGCRESCGSAQAG